MILSFQIYTLTDAMTACYMMSYNMFLSVILDFKTLNTNTNI